MSQFNLVNSFLAMRDQLGGGLTPFQMPQAPGIPAARSYAAAPGLPQAPGVKAAPPRRGSVAGSYDDWVDQIATIKGLTPQERAAFHKLGMGESGGRNIPQGITDVNTRKGTPAYGPWQVIRPTFERYKEPGYDDWHDPIANGLASINYQRARYGGVNRSRPGY